MFPEILLLTQTIVNYPNHKKEFCNVVLNIFFSTLISTEKHIQHDPITYNLLKGWLDILLTKTTPKPEEFYVKNFEKAFCNLTT